MGGMTMKGIKARYAKFLPVLESVPGFLSGLRGCEPDQADAGVEILAVQIVQTGYADKARATPAQKEWARTVCPDGYYKDGSSPTLPGLVVTG